MLREYNLHRVSEFVERLTCIAFCFFCQSSRLFEGWILARPINCIVSFHLFHSKTLRVPQTAGFVCVFFTYPYMLRACSPGLSKSQRSSWDPFILPDIRINNRPYTAVSFFYQQTPLLLRHRKNRARARVCKAKSSILMVWKNDSQEPFLPP